MYSGKSFGVLEFFKGQRIVIWKVHGNKLSLPFFSESSDHLKLTTQFDFSKLLNSTSVFIALFYFTPGSSHEWQLLSLQYLKNPRDHLASQKFWSIMQTKTFENNDGE